MKTKKILMFVFVFTFAFVSCNKPDDLVEKEASSRQVNARPRMHQQTEPHSLYLKGEQYAVVRTPVLNDLMTENPHLQFTIETIFKIDEYSEYQRFILSYYKEGGFAMPKGIQLYLEGNKLYFKLNNRTYVVYSYIERQVCYQVSIARKDNGSMLFYINGHQTAYEIDTSDFNTDRIEFLFIGAKGSRTNDKKTTAITIDEIRLWKYYLDESEINHYLFTNIEPVDYLLGYYNFNNRPLRNSFLDFSEYDSANFAHQRDGLFFAGANDSSYVREMDCISYRR